MKRLAFLLASLLTGAAVAAPMPAPMQWSDLLGRPHPKPDAHIAYGADPLQHVDLWLPRGKARHPVVLMVHGGCWQMSIARADIMDWIADDLRKRGIAVWNIEYRGVDRPGGGYPGTFQDVAAAADALRGAAAKYRLATGKIVAVGHSAGGHLALWLAARGRIAPASPLHARDPLRLASAISIGGLPDLEAASRPPGDTCDAATIPRLTGVPTSARPDVYTDTSPARLPQPAIPVVLVNASRDHIAPPAFAEAYAARVGSARLRRVVVPDEGHVELITPESRSWAAIVREIEAALS